MHTSFKTGEIKPQNINKILIHRLPIQAEFKMQKDKRLLKDLPLHKRRRNLFCIVISAFLLYEIPVCRYLFFVAKKMPDRNLEN